MELGSKNGVSAFFPAYNDGGTIASMVLSAILVLEKLTDDYEVIVVNDGSRDYTSEILNELERRYGRVRVVHHEQNKGYGGALRTGFS
ncbi:MAG: glycosyltransferase family 2 protein, partial [Anaerolineae bacterium]|nr:glycosyltransferase family 2 protein [Anaerolineae bacterium]